MACRLVNLHSYPLRIDLRGGECLLLAPHTRSRVLREELLYDNQHLAAWARSGWLRVVPARMDELRAEEQAGRLSPTTGDRRAGTAGVTGAASSDAEAVTATPAERRAGKPVAADAAADTEAASAKPGERRAPAKKPHPR